MNEKPKRWRLRYHLLTLVLMALIASVMLWINARKQFHVYGAMDIRFEFGWPLPFYSRWCNEENRQEVDFLLTADFSLYRRPYAEMPYEGVRLVVLVLDLSLGVAVIYGFGLLVESTVYRREARKL
jgi:hypothetical protein